MQVNSHPDPAARFIALGSLVVAGIALYLDFAESPFSELAKPQLVYAYSSENLGLKDDLHRSEMTAVIQNYSSIGAQGVFCVLRTPVDLDTLSIPDHEFEKIDSDSNEILIKLQVIPANSEVRIYCTTAVPPGIDSGNESFWSPAPRDDCPTIKRVYTVHGDAALSLETTSYKPAGHTGGVL